MTRTSVFIGMAIGGGLYQLGKVVLGFQFTPDTWISSVVFGGGALLTHWWVCRDRTHIAV